MSLAHPIALAWAALAVPIVIFYILKVRQRRVPVSTTMFWAQIFEEKPPRSLWEHLRHLLSLLVQLALLGLLVFALAEPFFRWEVLRARRLVLIVDNSASMNASDEAPSRLARARAAGQRVIDGLSPRDEMAIMAAGTEPQVACGLTSHQRSLRKALDAIGPTDGPTRVKEAIALARRLLADARNHQIIVLTDAAFPDAVAVLAPGREKDVEAIVVGKPTGNVAITRFQVRRSLLDPIGYEILAEVVNHSTEKVACRLEIDLGSDVIDVVPLSLEPGGRWSKVIEKTSAAGGRLSARIDRPDALLVDNQAWAILPRRAPRPVTLVSQGDLFLEKVMQAIPLVEFSKTAELPPPRAPGSTAALTVLHRTVPATLPPGPLLVVDPQGSCDLWDLGPPLANPIVTKQDKDSPLLAYVRLENVTLPDARTLALKGRAQVLAEAVTGEPVLCAFDRPEGRGKVLVLTVDLDKSDLPLQTAFPILVSNALAWFVGSQGELREALAAGMTAEVELPASAPGTAAAEWILTAPDGRIRPLPRGAARVTVGPLDRCGVWTIRPEGPPAAPEVELACNLASAEESNLRPAAGIAPSRARAGLGLGLGGQPVWFCLIAAAWGLAALEWFLYQRRWIS